MIYAGAVQQLYRLAAELHTVPGEPRRKFDLAQMRLLMGSLGDPQKSFGSVLIAGTNGKGSTAATLAAICAAGGYRTGLYTSPHLSRVNERIQLLRGTGERVERNEIADDAFANLFERVDAAAQRLVAEGVLPVLPSFFETLTAMAFCYFAAESVDIAILEVGMGGRLDATNIVEPLLSVITDISLDHTEWLGPTIAAIAREKAGILRPGGLMVTLPQHPEANQVLGEIAVPLGVKGISAAEFVPSSRELEDPSRNRYRLQVGSEAIEVDSPLPGQHQQRNVALAIASALALAAECGYRLAPRDIEVGIRQTIWPGRLESFPAEDQRSAVLLDVGHNPAGAWALRGAISQLAVSLRPRTLVFSCHRGKPVEELAQVLFPLFDLVILTAVDSPRAASLKELCAAADQTGAAVELSANPGEALSLAERRTPASGLIVVTGSVLLVGAVRSLIVDVQQATRLPVFEAVG